MANQKLKEKINELSQAQQTYISTIKDLESIKSSRMVQGSPETVKEEEDHKKVKRSKIYLINY